MFLNIKLKIFNLNCFLTRFRRKTIFFFFYMTSRVKNINKKNKLRIDETRRSVGIEKNCTNIKFIKTIRDKIICFITIKTFVTISTNLFFDNREKFATNSVRRQIYNIFDKIKRKNVRDNDNRKYIAENNEQTSRNNYNFKFKHCDLNNYSSVD